MKILEYLSDEECHTLKEHYRQDQNSIPCSYVLDENRLTNRLTKSVTQLTEIFTNLCVRDDLDEDLCACFMPGVIMDIKLFL
jgi:hypothetical protein